MPGKFEAEFKTPWALMKASAEFVPKIFGSKGPCEPFAAAGSMTYFNKKEASVERDGRKIVRGYDRLRDTTPFNPKQKRCDRMQPGLIWEGIYDENMRRKVAVNTSHWHGRSNRIQLDFPESKFYRSNKIQDQFYRRNNINVDSELDRQCHTY